MINWQKIDLDDATEIGAPGPLPADLDGLAAESLADLDWTDEALGYRGFGFVPVVDLEAAKAEKRGELTRQRDAIFQGGWTHDFGEAGVHTLDLRNADDKTNWTLLLIKTGKMVEGGAGAAPIKIRTAATNPGVSIVVPASEANAAMVAFLGWGEGVLARKWALEEAIDAAAGPTELDAIDIESGWPS